MPGTRAVAAVGTISVLVYRAAVSCCSSAITTCCRWACGENLLQIVVQGLIAGVLPIYLFARAVMLLGAGRASTFPALVPVFALVIGYLALGAVPSLAQLIGLVIVMVGFRFVVK